MMKWLHRFRYPMSLRGALLAGFLILSATGAFAKWEQEQVAMEANLQDRIERMLSKMLPPESFVVAVKVLLEETGQPARAGTVARRQNPAPNSGRFVLPGVPQKKQFGESEKGAPAALPEAPQGNTELSIKQIAITVLVTPDVPADQIRGIRDLLTTSLPFDPLRGDEMDIRPSPLVKNPAAKTPTTPVTTDTSRAPDTAGKSLLNGTSIPFLILLGSIVLGLLVFLAFLFGPVRGFLNRLLAVLPRVGEQAAYTASNATHANPLALQQAAGAATGPVMLNRNPYSIGFGSNPEDNIPFNFIREEELIKLPIFFHQLTASEAALIMAYLPPAWASRVMSGLDAGAQTAIMRELSQPREIPAETVKQIEKQLKDKLPYLVGGPDWIQSVYQLTRPEAQRELLGTMAEQSPDLAQNLRRKTFFFEDLLVLSTGHLRLLIQEAGYPAMALSLRDEKPAFHDTFFKKAPAAIRDILTQELEMAVDDKAAIADAKNRVMTTARKLLLEGRIALGGK